MFRPNTGAARAKATIVALALAALLSGCTRLQSYGLDAQKPVPGALPAGFTYWLPQSDVGVKAGLVLTDCVIAPGFDELAEPVRGDETPPPVIAVGFKLSGAITPGTKRGQQVQLDYRKMVDFMKTGSLSVERHANGMLKTVNADLADESPEMIAALAKAGVAIASLSVGGPMVPVLASQAALSAASQLLIEKGGQKFLSQAKSLQWAVFQQNSQTTRVAYQTCSAEAFRLLAEYRALKKQADALDVEIETAVANTAKLLEIPGSLKGTDLALLRSAQATLKDKVNTKTSVDEKMAANVAARTLSLKATGSLPGAVSFAPATDAMTLFMERLFVTTQNDVKVPGDDLPRVAETVPAAGDRLPRTARTVLGKDGFVDTQFVTGGIEGLIATLAKASASAKTEATGKELSVGTATVTVEEKSITTDPTTALKDVKAKAKAQAQIKATAEAKDIVARALVLPQGCDRVHPRAIMPGACTNDQGQSTGELRTGDVSPLRDWMPPGQARFGNGIVYVEPVRAKVALSGPSLTIRADAKGQPRRNSDGTLAVRLANDGFLVKADATFPEYGQFLILPLTSGFGEKSALEASFAEDGSLLKGKFGRTASTGKALAGSVQTVAEQWLAARVAKEAREIAVYDNALKQLQAQNKYEDERTPASPAAEDPIDAEIKALNKQRDLRLAKLAIIDADRKILEAQAAANKP